MARKLMYGGDHVEEILDRLGEGESLASICKDDHLPTRKGFHRLLASNPKWALAYTRARELAADSQFDEILDRIREARLRGDPVEMARLKLEIDTLKWKLARVNPKKYGDKVEAEVTQEKPVLIRLVGGK